MMPGQGNVLPVNSGETITISTPGSNLFNENNGNNTSEPGTTTQPAPTTTTSAEQHSNATPSNNSNSGSSNNGSTGSAMDSLAQTMAMQTSTPVVANANTPVMTSTNTEGTTNSFVPPIPNAGSQPDANAAFPTSVASINTSTLTVDPTAAASIKITSSEKPQPTYTVPNLSADELKTTDEVRASLPGLRGQIELFGLMNSGQNPELGKGEHSGWAELVNAQFIKTAPANAYVGGNNASKIVVGEKPNEAFTSDYGWIFNPKTGQLWAAGFDAKDRPLAKSTLSAAKPASKPEPAKVEPAKAEPTTAGVETDSPGK